MRYTTLSTLMLAALVPIPAGGQQLPVRIPSWPQASKPVHKNDVALWDLDAGPPPNSTWHLIFDTVSSLLQHWPNTRYRNGHNIVPGVIPTGTLLYHGTSVDKVPSVPEWAATDPEHSSLFCRGEAHKGCWHLTLVTTRPLQILHFDGSSAAKMYGGPMDIQDVLLWGEPKPDWTFSERKRIDELCAWGGEFGISGFARMEMDFEIMLCDFTDPGLEVVSLLNLRLLFPPSPPRPAHADSVLTLGVRPEYESIASGSWNNQYPGETRIQLDLARLISFYDISLAPSLVRQRQGKDRFQHRLEGIHPADARAVKDRLEEVLRAGSSGGADGSGIDWTTLFRVIVHRFADRLEFLRYVLDSAVTENGTERQKSASKAASQLRVMLTPYILFSVAPPNSTVGTQGANHSWAAPVFEHCATTHTQYISSSPTLSARLTQSERLLLNAIRETSREICRVVVRMWAEGAENGLNEVLGPTTADEDRRVERVVDKWKADLDALMAWLDWSVWVKCHPACGPEEICYLPTWPFFSWNRPRPGGEKEWRTVQARLSEENDWEKPQPKCISRIEPHGV